jgi:hypothetical protein
MNLAVSLRELAEPIGRDEKIHNIIARAARLSGIKKWRAFNIWYGKAANIRAEEIERVASALEKKRREAARNELHELRTRLARLESLLVQSDPDFHRPTIAAVRSARRGFDGSRRGDDSAVD